MLLMCVYRAYTKELIEWASEILIIMPLFIISWIKFRSVKGKEKDRKLASGSSPTWPRLTCSLARIGILFSDEEWIIQCACSLRYSHHNRFTIVKSSRVPRDFMIRPSQTRPLKMMRRNTWFVIWGVVRKWKYACLACYIVWLGDG